MHLFFWYLLAAIVVPLILHNPSEAAITDDPKYCGTPARDAQGQIIRNSSVLRAFDKAHPCPIPTTTTACLGWRRDHVIPLACGGCDSVGNLQWLPLEMWKAKSLWERKIYGGNGISEGCP